MEATKPSGKEVVGSYFLMGAEFQFNDEKILNMESGDDCTTIKFPLNCTLKVSNSKFYVIHFTTIF